VVRRPSQAVFSFSAPAPVSIVPRSAVFIFEDVKPIEVARQLTLMDYNLCRVIEPKEFLGLAWSKKDKEKRSPNLLRMITRFNLVSKWVAGTIVKETNLRNRAKLMSHFISILQVVVTKNHCNIYSTFVSLIISMPYLKLLLDWDKHLSIACKKHLV